MKASAVLFILFLCLGAEPAVFTVLKYGGGGDWYEGRVGAINLMEFLEKETLMQVKKLPEVIEPLQTPTALKPFVYMTGHGNIYFTDAEALALREWLLNGGFLYANDDYGMDSSFNREMAKVFPDRQWADVPLSHPVNNIYFKFPLGTPKIHEHDGGAPVTRALFNNGRIIVLYTKNTDIGDGWAPEEVHHDGIEVRRKALEFGVNVLIYALTK